MVHNLPLTTKEPVRADRIYGPARPLIQRGMKCHSNTSIKVPIIPLLADISLNHKDIVLYIYLFYINVMPFLHKNHARSLSSQQKVQFKERRKHHPRSSKKSTQLPTCTHQEVLTSSYTTGTMNLISIFMRTYKDVTSQTLEDPFKSSINQHSAPHTLCHTKFTSSS